MHNEALAIEQLKSLPDNAKMHLSHVLRNSLRIISGKARASRDTDIVNRVKELETKIEEMGL